MSVGESQVPDNFLKNATIFIEPRILHDARVRAGIK